MKKIKILLSILLLGIFFSLPNKVLANVYSSDYFIVGSTNHVADFKDIDVAIRFFTAESISGSDLGKVINYTISNPSQNKNKLHFLVTYYDENKSLIATCKNNKELSEVNDNCNCEVAEKDYIGKGNIKYYRVFVDIDKEPTQTKDIIDNGKIVNYEENVKECLDGFCIKNFSVEMKVNEDNTFDITENIDVNFTEYKHGIYRDIPVRNNVTRNDGSSYTNKARISNINVSEEYSKSNEGDYKRIKIGSASSTIIGNHSYTISYKYSIGKDKTKNYDELYFNLVGNYWTTYIERFNFNINMPKDFDKSKIGFSTGKYGKVGSTDVEYSVDGTTITGRYTKVLSPGEAVTIRLELPEGYFDYTYKPSVFSILLIVVPIIFAYLSYQIFKKNGVDDLVIETVEFYPPEKYNSLDIGYFYKDRATSSDAVSLLIYLANKGYIKITDRDENGELLKHNNFIITKIKDYDGNDNREKIFLNGLFKRKSMASLKSLFAKEDSNEITDNIEITQVEKKDLTDSFYTTINSVLSKTNTKSNREKIYDKESTKKGKNIIIMVLVSILLIYISLYANGLDFEEIIGLGLASLIGLFLFIFGLSMFFAKFFDRNQFLKGNFSIAGSIILMAIGAAIIIFVDYPILSSSLEIDNLFIAGISVCIICLAIMFASRQCLTKRTQYGIELVGKIRGFKNFLETAEKSKLEDLVNDNPTYFYDILPYTYVFGISKKWVSKFESIAIEPPSWYDTNNAAFNVAMMSTFMDKTMVSATSALVSSPSDSSGGGGFSGGGSSGGGSGGGGGGSW